MQIQLLEGTSLTGKGVLVIGSGDDERTSAALYSEIRKKLREVLGKRVSVLSLDPKEHGGAFALVDDEVVIDEHFKFNLSPMTDPVNAQVFCPMQPALYAGYYVLSQDVENPHADRRSRDFAKLPVWKAGTRFRVKIIPSKVNGERVRRLSVVVTKYGETTDLSTPEVLTAVRHRLVPAPVTVGQTLDRDFVNAEDVLAKLVADGFVTARQVDTVSQKIHDLEEDEFETVLGELRDSQWISR